MKLRWHARRLLSLRDEDGLRFDVFSRTNGLVGAEYAWGDELAPQGRRLANYWEGEFPYERRNDDGFARTSPAGYYPPNGYGLFHIIGNVWEWTRIDTAWQTLSSQRSLAAPNVIHAETTKREAGIRWIPRIASGAR